MVKYVNLLHFYVSLLSLLQKHTKKKNIKIQVQIRSKRIQRNICIIEFQIIIRQLKFQSNLK